jgi:hypothetical protein
MDATGNLVDVTPPAIVDQRAQAPRQPNASPASVTQPGAQASAESVVDAPNVAPLVPPLRPAPQMVVDPAARALPAPRYSADAGPASAQPQARQAQMPAARKPMQTATRQPAREAANETAPEPRRARVVAHGGRELRDADVVVPGVVKVAPQVHVEGSVVVVAYPNAHDPAWKRCQIDARAVRRGADCGPASYHPYGAGGYRPYGTYRAYGSAPGYIGAQPDPRIISIAAED